MEDNNDLLADVSAQRDVPLDHFEIGSLEKADPQSGMAIAIFERCLLTCCRVGKRMTVKSDDGNINTSPVMERRVTSNGYEILTQSGTIYRFRRTTPTSEQSSVSIIGRLRQRLMRLIPFRRKNA